jgi:hypothetical protein
MAVAKKDQERVTYAWIYGQQARKDGKERRAWLLDRARRSLACRASTARRLLTARSSSSASSPSLTGLGSLPKTGLAFRICVHSINESLQSLNQQPCAFGM